MWRKTWTKIKKEELALWRIDESPVKNLDYFLIKGIFNRLGLKFNLDLLDKIEKEAISTYDYLLNIVSARIVTLSSNDNILPLSNILNLNIDNYVFKPNDVEKFLHLNV